MLRAFDKDTGKVLWEKELESGPEAYRRSMKLAGASTLRSRRARAVFDNIGADSIAWKPGKPEAQGYDVFTLPKSNCRRDLLAGSAALWWGTLSAEAQAPANAGWLKDTFRELHIDAHFSQLPAPYQGFDAEASAQLLKDAGCQMVSLFAVCNSGYSYFPAKLGVPHPGLKADFTGEFTCALKKRGVRVLAYVSVGWSAASTRSIPNG